MPEAVSDNTINNPIDFLTKRGMSLDLINLMVERNDFSIKEIAVAWNAKNDQGMSDREILGEMKSNYPTYFDDEYDLTTSSGLFSCFQTLDSFEEREATWLVDGWIPEGQITLMAADGGIGKTSLWVDLAAAVSSGKRCVLDPPDYEREPQLVAFLSTEDSVEKKLKKKLRLAGANQKNIIAPNFAIDVNNELGGLKFGSEKLKSFIRHYRPALCIFDPVQGFIPPDINMGSRNAMRDCMAPLITLGEETGCTFIVICHTNKRKGAYGRDRIADSADLWDISRSVLMAGKTADGCIRYLSQEKNNYERLQETKLFSIDDDGLIVSEGETWKRDRDFISEFVVSNSAPVVDDIKERILSIIDDNGGMVKISVLEDKLKAEGYKEISIRRAKEKLKQANEITSSSQGFGIEKSWYLRRSIKDASVLPF